MSHAIKSLEKRSHTKAVLSLLICTAIIIGVFLGIVSNLLDEPNELVQEVGAKTFRMFTVLSNMLMAVAAALSIPFAVDGIRYRNYHLPKWIVVFLYSGTVSVSITFFVALLLLSPQIGFVRIMLVGSNLQLHTLLPVCAMVLFIFVNDFHRVTFKNSLCAIVPVLIYSVVYIISGIFLGEERGGWRDHYRFEEYLPWYLALLLIVVIALMLSALLRLVHNAAHKRDKKLVEYYYQSAKRYTMPTIDEALAELAKDHRRYDKGGDIVVPRRIIRFMERKYQSGKSLSELCSIYTAEYLNTDEQSKRPTR